MKKRWILTILMVVMLIYQAWRVQDYIRGSLTDVPESSAFWVSMAFLAFTELGLLAWMHIGQPNATTERQESVSSFMVWADYTGSMVLGLADLAVHNTIYQIDLSRIDPLLFFAPWIIVALNIGGWIIYTANDSQEIQERGKRRLVHAEVQADIHAQEAGIRQVEADMDAMARRLAPLYKRDIEDRVISRTAARLGISADETDLPPVYSSPKVAKKSGGAKKFLSRIWNGDEDDEPVSVSNNGYSSDSDDVNPTTR